MEKHSLANVPNTYVRSGLYRCEYHLGLMEKQARMLAELADASPVVRHRDEDIGVPLAETEFVVMRRQRLCELVDHMELEIAGMRHALDGLKS